VAARPCLTKTDHHNSRDRNRSTSLTDSISKNLPKMRVRCANLMEMMKKICISMMMMMMIVTLDIVVTFITFNVKITDIWHLVLRGKKSCLRSRHLILWSLETLTSQQRFYGMKLVTQNEKYYHPLSVLPEVGCIVSFVLNC
jgi:hypothetical protein